MDKLEDNFGAPQPAPGADPQGVQAYRIRSAWMRFANWARAAAPWFSLAVGVLSAWFVMGRGPAASGRVALAIFGVWALILLQRTGSPVFKLSK